MKHCLLGIVIPLVLAGCSSTYNSQSDLTEKGADSASTLKQAIKKLPKDLRPEDLESRSDTTVIIREGDNRTVKEFRVGGQLYGFQVIPKVGPPYFLVPADDPNYLIRPTQPERLIPSWQIITWK